jgi:hypothetical protein
VALVAVGPAIAMSAETVSSARTQSSSNRQVITLPSHGKNELAMTLSYVPSSYVPQGPTEILLPWAPDLPGAVLLTVTP